MSIMGLIFAFIIGAAIAWVWASTFNTHGPWKSFFWFFMVIFLFTWGVGSWLVPFGPVGWGVAWTPFVVTGLFMAVLLTAVTPRKDRRRPNRGPNSGAVQAVEQAIETRAETMDMFFWVLMVALACFAFGGFIWHPRPL